MRESAERLEAANQELERAHRQARTAFEIAQDLGSMPDIASICRFLLERLKSIITCRQIVLLLFDPGENRLWIYTEQEPEVQPVRQTVLSDLAAAVAETRFVPRGRFPFSVAEFRKAENIAAFPIRHENRVIGAMCVGCPGQCSCLSNEMDVIELVLGQSAGAIRRAMVHENEVRDLRLRIEPAEGYSGLVGKDTRMQTVYKLIEDVAPSDATVLILGESGTGKELAARAIHQNSGRSGGPFVVISCSAYPSTLLESELFGYEKGAFTGAHEQKKGRFEQADGGTIFLDEIGEISPAAQVKLLRLLQHRSFERIGGHRTLHVDVRILAATNRDLLGRVKSGHFRQDLYYRLNVIPIELPPLRERRNDIPMLARHFLKRFCRVQDKSIRDFSQSAMRLLLDHSWPGNVRELENSIEHAVVLARNGEIQPTDLPSSILGAKAAAPEEVGRSLQENEKSLLVEALEASQWNKAETARRLGIGRSTLYSKMKKLGIDPS
jgi:two-component system response regulator HydG